MSPPYFRPDLDLGRCGLGRVLTIDWIHAVAGLVTRRKTALRPTVREILVAAIAHSGSPLLDALSGAGSKAQGD